MPRERFALVAVDLEVALCDARKDAAETRVTGRCLLWLVQIVAPALHLAVWGDAPAASDAAELTELAERWRPWRAVAARMLWQHYLAR